MEETSGGKLIRNRELSGTLSLLLPCYRHGIGRADEKKCQPSICSPVSDILHCKNTRCKFTVFSYHVALLLPVIRYYGILQSQYNSICSKCYLSWQQLLLLLSSQPPLQTSFATLTRSELFPMAAPTHFICSNTSFCLCSRELHQQGSFYGLYLFGNILVCAVAFHLLPYHLYCTESQRNFRQ